MRIYYFLVDLILFLVLDEATLMYFDKIIFTKAVGAFQSPGLSKQAGGRRSSGGCYEVYRRLLCFGTLIIFKQVKNVNSTKPLCFSLFSPP